MKGLVTSSPPSFIHSFILKHGLLCSDPDTCDDGLSFEMTFRLDKDALKYNDMKYIVDSGASTFNSKGFTLYTVQGNLRADLAVANKEFCVQIPLIVQRWQDVLVTWKKSEGKYHFNNTDSVAWHDHNLQFSIYEIP